MKILRFIVLLCFINTISLFSQITSDIELTLSSPSNDDIPVKIVAGVDSRATDCVDPDIGEFSVPGFPPFTLFGLIADSSCHGPSDISMFQRDWRKIKGTKFVEYFDLNLQRGINDTVIIAWNRVLDKNIDSARIVDYFDGMFVNVKLSDSSKVVVWNKFIPSLELRIYYNVKSTSVSEENTRREKLIYPNPANNQITISTLREKGGVFAIYSAISEKIAQVEVVNNETTVNIADFLPGVYFVKLTDKNGNLRVEKFVKQ